VAETYNNVNEIISRYNLIIFGGSNGTNSLNDLMILDINHNTIEDKMSYEYRLPKVVGDLPTPREGHKTYIKDNILYLFGGCNYQIKECYLTDIYKINLNNYPFKWEKIRSGDVSKGFGISKENINFSEFMGFFINFGFVQYSKIERKKFALFIDNTYCGGLKPFENYQLQYFKHPRKIWFLKSDLKKKPIEKEKPYGKVKVI